MSKIRCGIVCPWCSNVCTKIKGHRDGCSFVGYSGHVGENKAIHLSTPKETER